MQLGKSTPSPRFRSVEKTSGSVIQLHPFMETSSIVFWSTRDHGLIRTVARGAHRPKSGFQGKLDLFFKLEIDYLPSRTSSLHTLREVALLDPREGLRKSYIQTLAAAYFSQLIVMVAEEGTPLAELADLLEGGLDYLAYQIPTRRAIFFFESETARLLGLGKGEVEALGELYGKIPSMRKELLQRLPS